MRMMRMTLCLMIAAAGLGLAMAQDAAKQKPEETSPAPANTPDQAAPTGASEESKDLDELRAVVESFTKAYNAKDAKALGDLFTEGAEVENEFGEVTQGRAGILERLTQLFAEDLGGTLELSVESLHLLSPESAVEQGTAMITPSDGGPTESSHYSVIYVKQDGRWLQARIRDEATAEITPHERLMELEWMIGEWVNESDDGNVHTTCDWSEDGNYLLRNFDVKVEGQIALSGIQRIGWDPLHKQFRTWIFDTEGGFAEGFLSRADDQWTIRVAGVRSDGQPVSLTNILTILGPDRIGWASVDRTVGGEVMPEIDEFIMVRKPPQPGN